MRGLIAVLLLLGAAVAPMSAQAQDKAAGEDRVVMVKADDRQMNAAIAEARKTLPEFWRMYDATKGARFRASLKIGFVQGDQTEHMWLNNIRRENGVVTGVLANTPELIDNVAHGDLITVDPKTISDWTFMKAGKTYGGFTSRVIIDRMPADEAAEARAGYAPTPLETRP